MGALQRIFSAQMELHPALLLPLAIVWLGFFLWWLRALIEPIKVPQSAWADSGLNQVLFVLLMVFASVVGTAVYWFFARSKLRGAGAHI